MTWHIIGLVVLVLFGLMLIFGIAGGWAQHRLQHPSYRSYIRRAKAERKLLESGWTLPREPFPAFADYIFTQEEWDEASRRAKEKHPNAHWRYIHGAGAPEERRLIYEERLARIEAEDRTYRPATPSEKREREQHEREWERLERIDAEVGQRRSQAMLNWDDDPEWDDDEWDDDE